MMETSLTRKAQVRTFSRLANLQAVLYSSYYLSVDAPRSIPEKKTGPAAPFCPPLYCIMHIKR
jgi:hypothetical protein